MTGQTPLFGIHYPDSTTKMTNLGAELRQLATDVESALVAAQVPPVTEAASIVAPTQRARDEYWGTPSDETSRQALQNRGATTIRLDKGWTERYYATYNADTNPQGKPTPGWYPITPGARYARLNASQQSVADSDVVGVGALSVVEAESNSYSFITVGDGRVTFTEPGLYSVNFMSSLSRPTTGRTFIECVPDGGVGARVSLGSNEDTAILHRAVRVLKAPLIVYFRVYKNTGASNAVTSYFEISKTF